MISTEIPRGNTLLAFKLIKLYRLGQTPALVGLVIPDAQRLWYSFTDLGMDISLFLSIRAHFYLDMIFRLNMVVR